MKKYIGGIGNYYGGLWIKKENEEYFWGIENYDGIRFEEIPEYLYKAIYKYQASKKIRRGSK